MDALPMDVQRYIQSFLFIVSWRAELHYFKLWHFLRTRTFENIPESMKSMLQKSESWYTYYPSDPDIESIMIPIQLTSKIVSIQSAIVRRYTRPLHTYLTEYRWTNVFHSWSLTSKFQLFGVHVYGTVDSFTYRYQLQSQAKREGCDSPDWKGCLPLDQYKLCCMERMPYIT